MNLFDLSLRINGYPLKRAIRELNRIQALGEAAFEAFLNAQKTEIIRYHLSHNSFYKSLFNNAIESNWNSIPVMTKKDLQIPLEKRLSEGFTLRNSYINKTSGSSGDPFIFAKDKFCHAMTWAVIQNRFGWFDIDFNTSKQARFYGIPLDKKGYFKERLKDKLSNRLRFSVFDLSDKALEQHLEYFNRIPFVYINGYTSSIVQFAKFLDRKQLVLNKICPALKACVVTSEMLFEQDKQLMESAFGVPIINEYGASELDLIAFENPQNEWQLNSETLFIEILDEKNNPVPDGTEGRIVITSLYNKAHPFIRYDIGDIGIKSKSSTIQQPILKKLIGRTNDLVILPSGKKAAGLTFYYITKRIIEDDGNVKEFVIEQQTKEKFHIRYVSDCELTKAQMNNITQQVEIYLESGLVIAYERCARLDRSNRGKLKQFSSKVN
ncbi:phenylacetate--CoA ligase family protein [Psychroserpens sp.]|uniref:phenylacetate--CoA ligase family protein n=1 Tax=Psychroserpens sp. TaxID=2020870 RepID=UPI001B1E4E8B|nr:phenylacetate--CoA ligase family protein [Psychroserpens sp.]MBO6605406.1 phenylacetate--CoA ligase family protein [Psychroserpens sp.]MBO6630182.1 phenylacetate--CoA ligase family protein [Psychroserpens sp.]MBO6653785.1 phenylacetate--CoA ligase family protein [Psychroserpens sp.]MBO6682106.1 phenylacetate--CoA ligase family protein [Psychroserpens sp.]MBO6748780.1 phenylacetate--CoA ligase family protein [Psychroserpens sp.]